MTRLKLNKKNKNENHKKKGGGYGFEPPPDRRQVRAPKLKMLPTRSIPAPNPLDTPSVQ